MAAERLIAIAEVPEEIATLTGGGLRPTVGTVRDWIARGLLRHRKIGGRVFVEAASLEDHINGRTDDAVQA